MQPISDLCKSCRCSGDCCTHDLRNAECPDEGSELREDFAEELVYNLDTITTIIAEETMYESSVVQYFTEKGIERGGRERAIEDLLDVLEIRFALGEADPLAARIRSIRDQQRLKQLHRAAIQVPSLEAFRPLLDQTE